MAFDSSSMIFLSSALLFFKILDAPKTNKRLTKNSKFFESEYFAYLAAYSLTLFLISFYSSFVNE